MKHFDVTYPLITGLRPFKKSVWNSEGLTECTNFKPTERGLIPYEPFIDPFPEGFLASYGAQLAWPFPQLLIGKKRTFFADRTTLYLIDSRNWGSDLYKIVPDTGTIIAGGKWDFIDMYDFWVFSNGACSVYYLNTAEMTGGTNTVVVKTGKTFQAGTYNHGRVILGGFDHTNFWETSWKTMWDTWITKKVDTTLNKNVVKEEGTIQMPIEENYVWWSTIGGGDVQAFFNESFFETSLLTASGYGTAKPWIFDLMRRNEWGFTPMPFQGSVLDIVPMSKWSIVYCEEGVQAMRPVTEPTPTFAQITLPCPGLANRGSVAGDDSRHVFVDKMGDLWQIVLDGDSISVTLLGYKEFLADMVNQNIQMSYCPDQSSEEKGEFYIGTQNQTYVLTGNKLFKTTQLATSVGVFQGRKIGLGSHIVDGDAEEGYFTTDVVDFGAGGVKTLEWIHLNVQELSFEERTDNILASIQYRFRKDQSFTSSAFKPLNDEGAVYFPVSGIDFRLRIKTINFLRFNIGINITFTYKRNDKRAQYRSLATSGASA